MRAVGDDHPRDPIQGARQGDHHRALAKNLLCPLFSHHRTKKPLRNKGGDASQGLVMGLKIPPAGIEYNCFSRGKRAVL